MVALRGKVVFPDTVSSFDVGRLVSLTAVSRASEQQNMTLFVCAQRDMTKDDIKPEDVYTVGTVVTIRQIAKLASNNLRVNVRARSAPRRKKYMKRTAVFTRSFPNFPPSTATKCSKRHISAPRRT